MWWTRTASKNLRTRKEMPCGNTRRLQKEMESEKTRKGFAEAHKRRLAVESLAGLIAKELERYRFSFWILSRTLDFFSPAGSFDCCTCISLEASSRSSDSHERIELASDFINTTYDISLDSQISLLPLGFSLHLLAFWFIFVSRPEGYSSYKREDGTREGS